MNGGKKHQRRAERQRAGKPRARGRETEPAVAERVDGRAGFRIG